MKSNLLNTLFACSLALASLSAAAADIATVRIVNAQGEHTVEVDLDQLAIGQTRQLSTAAGLPAIVSRNEDGLKIDVGGKLTEVPLGTVEEIDLTHAGEGKRIKLVKLDGAHHAHADAGADDKTERKIVVMHHGEGEHPALGEADIEALVAEIEDQVDASGADADKVIVTRKIVREDGTP